jgi:hypothetical protein
VFKKLFLILFICTQSFAVSKKVINSDVKVATSTVSSSSTTGALVVTGGTGVGGACYVAGVATFSNTLDASSSTVGGTVVSGGLAVAKSIRVGGQQVRLDFATAGSDASISARHTDNTNAASHAYLYAETGGGSGGDPKTRYFVTGGQDWAEGIDNSASDSFVISNSANLGTNNAMSCTTGLACSFPGQLIGKGTATNDSASAGFIGGYIESVTTAATAWPAATATFTDLASISLTAGDWDVSFMYNVFIGTAASMTRLQVGIGTASGTSTTGLDYDTNWIGMADAVFGAGGFPTGVSLPSYRISISGTTTFYVKGYFEFAGGTPDYRGRISARRVR